MRTRDGDPQQHSARNFAMLHLLLLTYPGEFKGNVKKWQRESKKNFDSFFKLANHTQRAS